MDIFNLIIQALTDYGPTVAAVLYVLAHIRALLPLHLVENRYVRILIWIVEKFAANYSQAKNKKEVE